MITYETGAKRSDLKPMYRKIPFEPMRRIALAMTKGSLHFDDNPLYESNWKAGDEQFAAECWDHLFEHLYKALAGVDDGEDHYAHAGCNLLFLMWFQDNGIFDIANPPVVEAEPEPEPEEVSKVAKLKTLLGLK